MATTVAGMSKQQLARALGATGAAFGLVSVVAPRAVAGTYGVPVTPAGLQLQRLFGSRALAISVLALTARTDEEVDRGLAVGAGMNAIDALTPLGASAQAGPAATLRAGARSLAHGAAAPPLRSLKGRGLSRG